MTALETGGRRGRGNRVALPVVGAGFSDEGLRRVAAAVVDAISFPELAAELGARSVPMTLLDRSLAADPDPDLVEAAAEALEALRSRQEEGRLCQERPSRWRR
jgi:hypothetical protein